MAGGFPITGRGMVFAVAATLVSIGASPAVAQAPERRIAVTAGDDYYQPNVVRVRAGDTIVFVNRGTQLHSPTLIDHEDLLDQAYVKPGQMVSFVVPDTLPPRDVHPRLQRPRGHDRENRRRRGTVRKERPAHGYASPRGAVQLRSRGVSVPPGQGHRPREWHEHRTHGGRTS